VDGNVRESGDDLLLWRKICAFLELEVTNGSAQGQVAIHATKVDETTCSANAGLLALVLRLVVEGQGLCASLDAEH